MKLKSSLLLSILLISAMFFLNSCSSFFVTNKEAFSNLFPDNNKEDLEHVLKELPPFQKELEPHNKYKLPLVVGVRLGQKELVAYNIKDKKVIWTTNELKIDSRPIITRDGILVVSERRLLVLDITTGKLIREIKIPEGWTFRGGASKDDILVIVYSKGDLSGTTRRFGKIVAINLNTGFTRWEHEAEFLFGAPSIYGNFVFVPWDGLNISILELKSGKEVCRLRSTDDIIHFITSYNTGIFYGAKTLYRLTLSSSEGHKAHTLHYDFPAQNIPGNPEYYFNSFEVPAVSSRKIRFMWAPQYSEDNIKFLDDMIYLVYFRFILGFDSNSGTLKWAYRHGEDIESSTVVPGGIIVVGRHGILSFIEKERGELLWSQEIGIPLLTASFDLGSFTPSYTPSQENKEVNLRERLISIITDPDNRLLPIRIYAIEKLAEREDPEITQDLLDIYVLEGIPEQLKKAVESILIKRKVGSSYLIDILRTQYYDFLKGTKLPPLDLISKALVAMEAKEALPDLITHFWNHETPPNYLLEVTKAIVALGDLSIVQPFKEFLLRYHADSYFKAHPEIIKEIIQGIIKFGDEGDKNFLLSLQNEPFTIPEIRQSILELFQEIEKKRLLEEEKRRKEEEEARKRELLAKKLEEESKPKPYLLSQQEINSIIKENFDLIKPCILDYKKQNENIGQIRLLFVITSEGVVESLSTLPSDPLLLTCITPKFKKIKFPKIRSKNQKVAFTIKLLKEKKEEVPQTWEVSSQWDWGFPPGGWGGGQQPQPQPTQNYPDQLYPEELPQDYNQQNQPPSQPPQENQQTTQPPP